MTGKKKSKNPETPYEIMAKLLLPTGTSLELARKKVAKGEGVESQT